MTTVNGTLQVCGDTNLPSLHLLCSGSSCQGLVKNWTCTQNQASWACSNGISCASASNFSATFTLTQNNITFEASQFISSHGYIYNILQGPSGNGTITNQTSSNTSSATSSPTPTKSSAAHHAVTPPPSWRTILSFLFLCSVLAVAPAVAECFVDAFSSLAQLSGAFVESVETGTWTPIQREWCVEEESVILGIQGYGEALEQQLMSTCQQTLLVGELAAAAALAGRNVAVTLPLDDALLAGIFGTAAAPEIITLGVLALIACPVLVDCAMEQVRQSAASGLCATTSTPPTVSSTTMPSPSSSGKASSSTTISISTLSSATATTASPTPSGGLTIPSVAGDNCAACQLSLYAIGIVGLAEQCHVAVPIGVAYDVSVLLCDSSFNGKYAAFCTTLCANQCATYNINSWVQSAGSSYMSNANLGGCALYCPGFKGDGRCELADPCGCGVGADTCVPC